MTESEIVEPNDSAACTSRRGFGDLPPATRKQIASRGGRAAHARGHAHEFTPAEASAAGRIGGMRVSADREHMAALGRRGAARRREMLETQALLDVAQARETEKS